MRFFKKHSFLSAITITVLVSALITVATGLFGTRNVEAQAQAQPQADGVTNCFDYYKFGSVEVNLQAGNADSLSGTSVTFSGNIKNTNSYPIVDGAVYVKIFRKSTGPNAAKLQSQGLDLVDQSFVMKDINLDAKKSAPISFTWKIPSLALSGDYQVATYFVSQNKFNLLGLSFTDDIVGNTAPFKVTGQQNAGLFFDKNAVRVANDKYNFAAFTPKVDKSKPVKIDFNLVNTFKTKVEGKVHYTVYSWDALKNENVVTVSEAPVVVEAGKTLPLSYTVDDSKHPVYYVVIEADYKDSKSIIDVRFTRDGIDVPRLNFVGLNSYPLTANSKFFACMYNSGTDTKVDNSKMVLTLKDKDGKNLDTYTYTGDITGTVMGVVKTIDSSVFKGVKSGQLADAIVTADLYQNGALVDSARMVYDCSHLNPSLCQIEALTKTNSTRNFVTSAVIILAIIVLLIALAAYHGHLHRKDVGRALLLFIAVSTVGLLGTKGQNADADDSTFINASATTPATLTYPPNSVQGNLNLDTSAALRFTCLDINGLFATSLATRAASGTACPDSEPAYFLIQNLNFSYTYGADMKNVSGATPVVVNNGGSVPVGTKLSIKNSDFNDSQIGWFISGNANDTPYGYWSGETVPRCSQNDKVGSAFFKNVYVDLFLPITVTKPLVTVRVTDPLGDIPPNADFTYTTRTAGPITATVTFANTSATAQTWYDHWIGASLYTVIPQSYWSTWENFAWTTQAWSSDGKIYPGPFDLQGTPPNAHSQYIESTCLDRPEANNTQDSRLIDPTLGVNAQNIGKNYTFTVPGKTITMNLTATAAVVSNNPPTAPPTVSYINTCDSSTNITTSHVTFGPISDPDAGDSATYQFQADQGLGAGYAPNPPQGQTTNTVDIAWLTSGSTRNAKVHVRSIDTRGATSAWTETIISIPSTCVSPQPTQPGNPNGSTATLACNAPIKDSLTNKVSWTATITNGSPNYTFNWSSAGGTTGGPNFVNSSSYTATFTTDNAVAAGGAAYGPTVYGKYLNDTTITNPPSVMCTTYVDQNGGGNGGGPNTSLDLWLDTTTGVAGGNKNSTATNNLIIRQGAPAYLNLSANNVKDCRFINTDSLKDLANPSNLFTIPDLTPSTKPNLGLNTNYVGKYRLSETCTDKTTLAPLSSIENVLIITPTKIEEQ